MAIQRSGWTLVANFHMKSHRSSSTFAALCLKIGVQNKIECISRSIVMYHGNRAPEIPLFKICLMCNNHVPCEMVFFQMQVKGRGQGHNGGEKMGFCFTLVKLDYFWATAYRDLSRVNSLLVRTPRDVFNLLRLLTITGTSARGSVASGLEPATFRSRYSYQLHRGRPFGLMCHAFEIRMQL